MSDTICGHERGALIWVLKDPDPLNNAERERRVIFAVSGVSDFASCVATHKQRFASIVSDPAKLSELITTECQRRGFDFINAYVGAYDSTWICIAISWHTWLPRRPHEAHAALLRILELPEDATAEHAVKALTNAR